MIHNNEIGKVERLVKLVEWKRASGECGEQKGKKIDAIFSSFKM